MTLFEAFLCATLILGGISVFVEERTLKVLAGISAIVAGVIGFLGL